MIKSRLSGNSIFWGIFMFIPLFSFIFFSIKILKKYSGEIGGTLILLLFAFLFYFLMNFLKHIKIIKINKNKLKYYSFIRPFGKTLNMEDFIGKITITESGTRGSYNVVYLIDKQNKTSFKLMGLHYNNFEEINNAINLKKINFSPTASQYFKLLFFEKIIVKNDKSSNNEVINIILEVFKIISTIGIILVILGFLIKKFL
ncbi:hypothetical protein [Chryseobacterium sp. AG363]|uniref:hypothetical protein n=1 Tax=Chryseobacterium sp. AG363 TaxID=2183997 RepID=UPI000E76F333|nr:hypothetical protein [Chryseobacterium sp. AG363]RKE71966.1 hypothetical protein DEU39_4638 [Chryseobacterium sp. AG363]